MERASSVGMEGHGGAPRAEPSPALPRGHTPVAGSTQGPHAHRGPRRPPSSPTPLLAVPGPSGPLDRGPQGHGQHVLLRWPGALPPGPSRRAPPAPRTSVYTTRPTRRNRIAIRESITLRIDPCARGRFRTANVLETSAVCLPLRHPEQRGRQSVHDVQCRCDGSSQCGNGVGEARGVH